MAADGAIFYVMCTGANLLPVVNVFAIEKLFPAFINYLRRRMVKASKQHQAKTCSHAFQR